MPTLESIAPSLSADVLVRPLDADGRSVVKDRKRRTYLKMGPEESFLLGRLDGKSTYGEITAAFEQRFNELLTCEDVGDFVKVVKKEGLLAGKKDEKQPEPAAEESLNLGSLVKRVRESVAKQSPVYFRVSLFNPDRLLNWLEPRTRWLFSWQLAAAALVSGVAALLLTWANRDDLVTTFSSQISWHTFALAWVTAIVVTVCHEFGHGLACKRYGGEVREMGALWIFFTPCLYCNVSDAWLLPSRWQRLLISMAGTYVDFLIWIVAVFVWRVSSTDTWVNYAAWIIVTTCGLRVAFNINPMMRLDGYYALADLLGVHNLRRRGRAFWLEHLRWLLWGGKRPEMTNEGRILLAYGAVTWLFSVVFLGLLCFHIGSWLKGMMGFAGFFAAAGFYAYISKRYFKGSLGEDFMNMFKNRKKRILIGGAVCLVLLAIPIYDRAGGNFQVRPVVRWEVRAPIAGFLREVSVNEGEKLGSGTIVGRIEVPELTSNIIRKNAEIKESEANLKKLQAGTRPEVIAEQKQKVQRAIEWRDMAIRDLEHSRQAFEEEQARFDLLISQARTERDYRATVFTQANQLHEKGGLAGQQLLLHKNRLSEAESALFQAQAQKRAHEAKGVLQQEGELARREKELADTKAALALLEAGNRPEEIEAEAARLNRLHEELNHLRKQESEQVVICPVNGTMTTPHLNEKIGQYFERGALICLVEDLSNLEAEISVPEQQARMLEPGQTVSLKPRALPFCRLTGKVDRIAPSTIDPLTPGAKPTKSESSVTVYCRVENKDEALRTGMTGFGLIHSRLRPLGLIAATRGMAFLRTEFWW